ncbi:four helix bundle protein [Thermodesulfobacteriota bacterium]
MAYYEHLPIYKKAMETAVYFEKIVRNFSRYNKYNLGAEMRTKSRDIVKLIIRANSSRNKLPLLYELREHIEELKVLIRISKESKAFSNFNSFKHAIGCVVSVGKQNEGWIKSHAK